MPSNSRAFYSLPINNKYLGTFIGIDKEQDCRLNDQSQKRHCEEYLPKRLTADIIIYCFAAAVDEKGQSHGTSNHKLAESTHRTRQFVRRHLFYKEWSESCVGAHPVSLQQSKKYQWVNVGNVEHCSCYCSAGVDEKQSISAYWLSLPSWEIFQYERAA